MGGSTINHTTPLLAGLGELTVGLRCRPLELSGLSVMGAEVSCISSIQAAEWRAGRGSVGRVRGSP
eukprot:scaffold4840_cov115-Isochrysis_galbana.AAC.20